MVVRMWSNRNAHSLLMEMQNGTAPLEDSLAISYKAKYTLTTQYGNRAPRYLANLFEIYLHAKTYS